MRFGAVSTITFFVATGILACTGNTHLTESTQGSGGATGGTTSSGGINASGGSSASGGITSSGGTSAQGGTTPSGGSSASGGVTSSGGTSASGGATALGGASARGGSGGTSGSSGTSGSGGSGGVTASSGSSGGVCTDDPPPDQSPTCAQWLSYSVCSQDWFKAYCNRTCGRCTGTGPSGSGGGSGGSSARGGSAGSGGVSSSGGTAGGGGVSSTGTTNPPITGSNGFATRYWDCCKPSCSWTTSVPSCQKDGTSKITDKNAKSGCDSGGSAFECYDFSPWYDSSTNMAYGFAAYNASGCGVCYELQFTGDGNSGPNAGAQALKGQQMIVQVINIGNITSGQFDLLIPGGGVGAMTNGCSAQWGSVDLGATNGGLLTECNGDATCMKGKCQSVFGSMPGLKAGCDWFTGWFSSADNPKLIYKQVSCPSQITSKSGISG